MVCFCVVVVVCDGWYECFFVECYVSLFEYVVDWYDCFFCLYYCCCVDFVDLEDCWCVVVVIGCDVCCECLVVSVFEDWYDFVVVL